MSWRPLAVACAAWAAVAGLGALATELGPWYYALRQPPWKPPDAAFGPAWSLIFLLVAISAALAWRGARDGRQRLAIVLAYACNGVLNLTWSILFFTLRRPDWAVAEVVLLWASIVSMIIAARPAAPLAAALLVPYLAWVSFAALLNLAVVQLNRPFGAS